MKYVHGLSQEQFCNRILHLMNGSDKDTFEFYKDSLEGRFLKIFRSRQLGDYESMREGQYRYYIWKFDERIKMIITQITVEIDRKSLIGILNKNIEDTNNKLILRYRENAVLLRKVSDPLRNVVDL